ncbi:MULTISPECIES: hypothetical protein [Enterococcus]|uniref:Helix-turn-helix domain-containing protein n=1 Tax=Enterococcus alishanensis TaxID=1303817 RepID=A0ABS6TBN4_9ENTE|nr:hypothetical protein [Enterococcus alishanensis]
MKRLLVGESVTSLEKEFNIPSNRTIYIWKKWYAAHDLTRLKSSSGRLWKAEKILEKE